MNRIQKNAILGAMVLVAALALIGRGGADPPDSKADESKTAVQTPAESGHEHHGTAASEATPAVSPVGGTVKIARDKGVVTTITGEVMDPACFLEAGPKSIVPGHFQCAVDCARSGQTLAIYDREADRIYFIAGELPGRNPNDPVMAYIHKKVDVTGTVYHRSQAWGIVIVKVAPHDPAAAKASAPNSKGTAK
jgi:hypothetical protein